MVTGPQPVRRAVTRRVPVPPPLHSPPVDSAGARVLRAGVAHSYLHDDAWTKAETDTL